VLPAGNTIDRSNLACLRLRGIELAVSRVIDFGTRVMAVRDDLFAHRAGGAEKGFELSGWQSLYFRLQLGSGRAAQKCVEDVLR